MPLAPHQIDAWIIKDLFRNLHIECTSATQVIIKAGSTVGADDGSIIMSLTSDLTLDITTTGVNGLDAGSETANTWYYIHMIWNPNNGVVAGLLSASSSSPMLPSGYTKKRLVGAVRNDSGSDFLSFVQIDRNVTFETSYIVYDVVSASSNWIAISLVPYMPAISRIAKTMALLQRQTQNVGDCYLYVTPKNLSSVGSGGVRLTGFPQPDADDHTDVTAIVISDIYTDTNRVFSHYASSTAGGIRRRMFEINGFVLNL